MMSFLFPAIGMVIMLLLVAGGAYVVIRVVSREPFDFSFRTALSIYFVIVIGASIIVFAFGLGALLNAGLASAFGREFSYRSFIFPGAYGGPVITSPPPSTAAPPEGATATPTPTVPTPAPLIGPLGRPIAPPDPEQARARQVQDLEQQQREGYAQGASLAVSGFILWLIHRLARRALLPDETDRYPIRRTYAVLMLAIFSLVGLIAIPVGISGLTSYLLAPPPAFDPTFPYYGYPGSREPPGAALSTALAVIPFWVYYFSVVLRGFRSS